MSCIIYKFGRIFTKHKFFPLKFGYLEIKNIQYSNFQTLGHTSLKEHLHLTNGLKVGKFFKANLSTLPNHKFANLPSLSPTMDSGTISSWSKKEGDKLEEGDTLCQIETDKAVMAMETPFTGYLAKTLYPEHTKNIPINKPIAIIVKNIDDILAFKDYVFESTPSTPIATPATTSPQSTDVVTNMVSDSTKSVTSEPSSKSNSTDRVFASPLARKISQEHSININTVKGTGPGGRILACDVRKNMETKIIKTSSDTAQTKVRADASTNYIDIEVSKMREVIAKRLCLSKSTIPHFQISQDIYMEECMSLRKIINDKLQGKAKLSLNDFIIKAAALTLIDIPACNSHWMENLIRQYNTVDISVAVSTDSGLITPIVFDASSKSLGKISMEMGVLASKARQGTLSPNEFQGGTFTISNLGMAGIPQFNAIINPPQSCILAVGCSRKMMIVSDDSDSALIKSVMSVTLSCDHRVVDGMVGASWLKKFKEYLENPYQLII